MTLPLGISRRGGRKWCLRVVPEKPATLEWECPKCGHRWKHTMLIGPRGFRKPMNQALLVKMSRYWSKEGGGANALCPKCEKKLKEAP